MSMFDMPGSVSLPGYDPEISRRSVDEILYLNNALSAGRFYRDISHDFQQKSEKLLKAKCIKYRDSIVQRSSALNSSVSLFIRNYYRVASDTGKSVALLSDPDKYAVVVCVLSSVKIDGFYPLHHLLCLLHHSNENYKFNRKMFKHLIKGTFFERDLKVILGDAKEIVMVSQLWNYFLLKVFEPVLANASFMAPDYNI